MKPFAPGPRLWTKECLKTAPTFYFAARSLSFVVTTLATARQRKSAVGRAAAFALVYNTTAEVICLSGQMNPLLAAIFMSLGSLITLGLVEMHVRRTEPPARP